MIIAESPTLRLRSLQESDLPVFHAYRADPQLCRYQDFEPLSERQSRDFIKSQQNIDLSRAGEWMQIGMESRAEGQLIGDCALLFWAEEPRIGELGITLAPQFHGRGLAQQCGELLLRTLFTTTLTHKLMAYIDLRNAASIRLVERLGFHREGRSRKSCYDTADQAWVDEWQYGILREDFIPPA
ncbi:MAG: GNAT family N-acetyltransferase [Bacteroidota bacterium]